MRLGYANQESKTYAAINATLTNITRLKQAQQQRRQIACVELKVEKILQWGTKVLRPDRLRQPQGEGLWQSGYSSTVI